jgi:transcriptional regulator with XRE-family HTH domain
MDSNDELKQFLRASRDRLSPEDVGLAAVYRHTHAGQARRVKGLRREEVAGLAGVSVDYYARLEQGRTKQVSPGILRAIAGTLRLNDTERDYFFALVAAQVEPARDAPPPPVQLVRPGVHRLLETLSASPAFVLGRGMQILAANTLAREVLFDVDVVPLRERNLARWVFLNDEARHRYADWPTVARDAAAILRIETGMRPNDRYVNELVGELSVKSQDFRHWWAQHNVYECTFGSKTLNHPLTGPIHIDYEALDVPGSSDQKIFIYTAEPGSQSQDALDLLASWAAGSSPSAAPEVPRPSSVSTVTDAADSRS